MRRGVCGLIAGVAGLAVWAPAASGEPAEIDFGSYFFTPDDATVNFTPGESTAVWTRNDPGKNFHSIVSDDGFFGTSPGGFSEFSLRASAGSFAYHCGNHPSLMDGVLRIRPIVSDVTDDSFRVTWADGGSTTGASYRVRFKIQGRPGWRDWIPLGSDKTSRPFGQKDKPVDVKPSKTYLIEARSFNGNESGWSPTLSVTP